MEVSTTFEDGFNWTSVVGTLFIALVMVPGSIYMQLLAGIGVGGAAQWVTVILFLEVARRANKDLKRPDIFVLFFITSAIIPASFQGGLLYQQFFAQSQAAAGMGITEQLPWWYSPTDPDILAKRTFFDPAWYPAVMMIVFQRVVGRINHSLMSYTVFRLASDVEKLPFPMATVAAQGLVALVEQQEAKDPTKAQSGPQSWRWRVFSVGGVLGLCFGAVYMALPVLSSAVLGKPITIFPIPFVDWTSKTNDYLPGVATGLSLDMGQFMLGMALPFWAMIGTFFGFLITAVANPILYNFQLLPSWSITDDVILTQFHTFIDFYFSFGLGLAFAILVAGLVKIFKGARSPKIKLAKAKRQEVDDPKRSIWITPKGRGDIPQLYVVAAYLVTSMSYVCLSGYLIKWNPRVMVVLMFFAFLYSPLISYFTARMEGIAGQVMAIPYVREAAFILCGYKGVDVWFLPIPMPEFAGRILYFRKAELLGTSFLSIWKAELILVPLVLVSITVFSQFIWSLAPIPGPQYPFAERMWELHAATQSIMVSSTLGRFSTFQQAFRVDYLLYGFSFGTFLLVVMSLLGLPMMLIYGTLRGINSHALFPMVVPTQFIGAMIGKFYFERKMGLKWRQYIPIVAAGFSCGMGLVTVFAVGVNFLSKAIIKISF